MHPFAVPTPDEAAVADLNAELERYRSLAVQRDQEVAVLRSLLQSGKGFSEILEIKPLLEAFMAVCRERCAMSTSVVLLKDDLDPDADIYRVRAFHGLPTSFVDASGETDEMLLFRLPADHGLLWQQINQGDVFAVLDMVGRPHFATAWQQWNLGVLQSTVWCPLIKGGEVLGILTLGGSRAAGGLTSTEFLFLQEICAVAATNMDSTLKYGKNLKILANLRTLYDVNQQLANLNDFKDLMRRTLQSAVEAMGAQKANLMLVDQSTGLLEIKVVDGAIPEAVKEGIYNGEIKTKAFRFGEGNAGTAAKERRAVRVNHKSRIPQVGANIVHCILSVPLIYGDEVIGVMNMTNKTKRVNPDDPDSERVLDPLGLFTETDSQLALGLADQAAVNLNKARIYNRSITDRLTGLKNTRFFEEQLADATHSATQTGGVVSLAVTDLDHFKRFNDTHGHQAGDLVLAETARLLGAIADKTPGAEAFRYGGEEFCMLLRGHDAESAAAVLEQWRRAVEELELAFEGKRLSVTGSVGICEFPRCCDHPAQLFATADAALYDSKHAGRNRVTCAPEPSEADAA